MFPLTRAALSVVLRASGLGVCLLRGIEMVEMVEMVEIGFTEVEMDRQTDRQMDG